MSSDIEREKLRRQPIYDEAELLIAQAREQVEETFRIAVMQINTMAQIKIDKLGTKNQPYDGSEYSSSNPANKPALGVNDPRPPTPTTTKE